MNIAIMGYGKMGKEIEKVALRRGHRISVKVDEENAGSICGKDLSGTDVAIEFSTPETAVENIFKCFDAKIPVIVGTTGWMARFQDVKNRCEKEKQALFWSSNFSLGVNIFFRMNEHLARLMNGQKGYEPSMTEIHHIQKKDAPSGTAITLAEGLMKNYERKKKWINNHTEREDQLSVISLREGETPGTHIVRWQSEVDDIEIRHTAHNRSGFAIGAILAAEYMKGKTGVRGMADLLGF
ncbi:MAG: 4-hydroxy-tetrahydrodipicolinate reductase [Bacteroidia bacterium]|nr:4-hydroxy-tetrahydrodipicolinate reductase [Bacteroidia bacterium]